MQKHQYKKRDGIQPPSYESEARPLDAGASNQALLGMLQSRRGHRLADEGALQERLSARFGVDMAGLHVYRDAGLGELGQTAYARGNEIHLSGDVDIASKAGEAVLLHEAAHVLQQGLGQATGGGILESPHMEAEADAMAAGSMGGISLSGFSMPAAAGAPVQGWDWWDKRFNKPKYARTLQNRAAGILGDMPNFSADASNTAPYQASMDRFMGKMGYRGTATVRPNEVNARYNAEVSPQSGITFGRFMRELSSGQVTDNIMDAGTAPDSVDIKYFDQAHMDSMLAGDKAAYDRIPQDFSRGIAKFAQMNWTEMSDEDFLKNYHKYYAMSRHSVAQKQLFEKTKFGADYARQEDASEDKPFEKAVYYMEALNPYMQFRLQKLATGDHALGGQVDVFRQSVHEQKARLPQPPRKRGFFQKLFGRG